MSTLCGKDKTFIFLYKGFDKTLISNNFDERYTICMSHFLSKNAPKFSSSLTNLNIVALHDCELHIFEFWTVNKAIQAIQIC